jgi:aldose 1-epimerase
MFEIKEENNNELDCTIIKNSATGEYVSIAPEFGANVNQITLKKRKELYSILDGNRTKDQFSGKNMFKGAKLFPFVNRIQNGTYRFDGKTYQLDINYPEEGNAAHGIVYYKRFRLENRIVRESYAEALFKYDYDGSDTGYPFPFDLELTYKLDSESGFTCITRVANTGVTELPFGDGWHPFFSLNNKVDNLFLTLPEVKIIEVDDKLIPTGIKKPFKKFLESNLIGNTTFDNCFQIEENCERYQTKIYDPERRTKIIFWQDGGIDKYNYLQIYIPPDRRSIAIEPMTGNINNFNNKDGLLVIKPGESFNAKYGVNLE